MPPEAPEEENTAQVKEKSLLGNLLCLKGPPEKFLEWDIFSYSRNWGQGDNFQFPEMAIWFSWKWK